MNSSRTELTVKDLRYRYADAVIIDKVGLTLEKGEIASIMGLSGSGKTTILNLIAGLDRAEAGTIEVNGRVGYMHQKDLLMPWKRVIDNIALPFRLNGMSAEEARKQVKEEDLARFGLAGLSDRYPHQLSGGQRQRVALLRTWVYGSDLLLLDEPFAGVDDITREQLTEWLQEIIRTLNLTALLVTHDIDEAIHFSDRVYVLSADQPATFHPPVEIPRERTPAKHGELQHEIRTLLHTKV